MIELLITVVLAALIFYLCWWFISFIGLPAPFDKVARVVVALFALIFLINLLSGIGGGEQFFNMRWRH